MESTTRKKRIYQDVLIIFIISEFDENAKLVYTDGNIFWFLCFYFGNPYHKAQWRTVNGGGLYVVIIKAQY